MMHLRTVVLFCFTWFGTEGQVSEEQLDSKGLESRILYGHKAKLGQFPWQAALRIETFCGNYIICGGSLINDQWILTAAHCFRNVRLVDIALGTTYFDKRRHVKDDSRREFSTSTFYVHKKHDCPNSYNHDIALIKLPTSLKFNHNIRPIKLAKKTLPPGSKVVASGWGIYQNDHGVLDEASNDLLYGHMSTISNDICRDKWANDKWISSTLCAKGENHRSWLWNKIITYLRYLVHFSDHDENACSGDSGGPLVYYNDTSKTYFLVGVTSYRIDRIGKPICQNPGFYTDVYKFRKWIKKTINDNK